MCEWEYKCGSGVAKNASRRSFNQIHTYPQSVTMLSPSKEVKAGSADRLKWYYLLYVSYFTNIIIQYASGQAILVLSVWREAVVACVYATIIVVGVTVAAAAKEATILQRSIQESAPSLKTHDFCGEIVKPQRVLYWGTHLSHRLNCSGI